MNSFWKNRNILVTGHTGFKGAWLTLWLKELEAAVTGFALAPPTQPNLFELAGVQSDCIDVRGDMCDHALLKKVFSESEPEIVFHLSAQPLVRESYRDPRETWRVNVMGTLELLEVCRITPSVKTVVVITTDKVYENPERGTPFIETDALGGYDPYSSSKAAAEILCASWRRSFVSHGETIAFGLATARAGNVIGGGDFASDRLIPDLVRAQLSNIPARLRYPKAVRPWQHVLEPLCGYLSLAEKLHKHPDLFSKAYNFGPPPADIRSVGEVADAMCQALGTHWGLEPTSQPHEAGFLRLNSEQAEQNLQWHSRFHFAEALQTTCDWYEAWKQGADLRAITLQQIRKYQTLAPILNSSQS